MLLFILVLIVFLVILLNDDKLNPPNKNKYV